MNPTTPGAEAPTVEAFDAGRDLAFAYIRAAIAADASFTRQLPYIQYATGTLRPFLERLIAQPELIDGFDAFLTAVVGVVEDSCPNVDTPWLEHGHVYGPDRDWINDGSGAAQALEVSRGSGKS